MENTHDPREVIRGCNKYLSRKITQMKLLEEEKKSFKQEFRKFLKAYKVEYDERYIWN